MKSIRMTFLLLLLSSAAFAQVQKMSGQSGKPVVVQASDPARVDFFPSLIHLDQHPIPSAEYGSKKEELNKLRSIREAQLREENEAPAQKTRGLAPNPFVLKGVLGNTSNGVPNDNDIAVSNAGKVVSVVNSNMQVYDDTGAIVSSVSLTNLVAPVGVYTWISDPRVIYDPNADRFILVCFSGNVSWESTILVGFTQTNDPSAAWNFYTLNGNSFNDSTWSDYPIISISDKDLFITFNQVKDNVSWTVGFSQSVIWQIDKQTGYTANPLQYTLWSNIQYGGTNLRNICPAKYQTTNMGNNMYFLTLRNVASSNDSIFVTEITNSQMSGQATLQQKLLVSPVAYGFPPNARQKHPISGNVQYLMTNDARVLAAVYENDYIHFGSNTVNPAFFNAAVYLGTIQNISSATPVVQADIVSTATMEYGYPSMTYVGGGGNDHRLLYTFSHCVTDSFPGTSVVYRDAAGNWSDILRVKNGATFINVLADTVERWGDYTNIQKMYNNPNKAYLAGSWGRASKMDSWVSIIGVPEWPTTVEEIATPLTPLVYPNPVTDQRFTVQFDMPAAAKVSFELCDMQGRVLYRVMETRVKQGLNEYSIATGQLSTGSYLFRLRSEQGVLSTHPISIR